MTAGYQDFRSPSFLRLHMCSVMDFYEARAVDPSGGMYQFFYSDGTAYDRQKRHLVNAARYVVTYSMLYRLTRDRVYKRGVEHATSFLRNTFRDGQTDGYVWVIDWCSDGAHTLDATRYAYGLAFVMLAYAHATMCGIDDAADWLAEAFDMAERFFWEPQARLYADEATSTWTLSRYRGQNANMHACEAMIAAFRATRDHRYLTRAEEIAQAVTQRLASRAGGLIWEHYREDWSVDWEYNRDNKSNKYRPWGFQPGHFTEWSKLLLQLDTHLPASWHLPRAIELFDAAMTKAWDHEHGGLHYALAPDGSICDADKYHWVQAESFAAAALLAKRTGERIYWEWYDRLWAYCWTYFVDHQNGAWLCSLDTFNRTRTDEKKRANVTGYHNIGACHDVLVALDDAYDHLPRGHHAAIFAQ